MDENKRLLKRIIQSENDLIHAAECAEQILMRNLHSSLSFDDERLLRCLNTALFVSYARPFSINHASDDVCKDLPGKYLRVFSKEQRLLHDQLIEARNRDHAHSDPKGRQTKINVQKWGEATFALPIGRDAFAPLPRKSVERVVELIECLQAKLAEEHIRIQNTLEDGDCF